MISKRQIPLLDLRAQLAKKVLSEVIEVIDSQQFILGKHVQQLEAEIADYCSCKFAVGCASGSDALFLAMLAAGNRPGDEVLTTPYTFFATAGAISQVGANPVFIDVERGTFNIDMNHLEDVLEKSIRAFAQSYQSTCLAVAPTWISYTLRQKSAAFL